MAPIIVSSNLTMTTLSCHWRGTSHQFPSGAVMVWWKCIEGMMNSDKYKTTLHSHLLLVIERDFADGDCIFQQDLAQCHTSKKNQVTFFEEKDITILDWPGNTLISI